MSFLSLVKSVEGKKLFLNDCVSESSSLVVVDKVWSVVEVVLVLVELIVHS